MPQGGFLISERGGKIFRITAGRKEEIVGLPTVYAIGQGGLLDIELHPQFTKNNMLFFAYTTKVRKGYTTAVARSRLVANRLQDTKTIFVANGARSSKIHFGSRISFLADNTLLVTIGDRGNRNNGQDLSTHPGSLIRIDQNGNPPANNPRYRRDNALPELYSIGHRNAQALVVAADQSIYLIEHGPRGGDELNRIVPGKNYGWPIVTFGREYVSNAKIGIEQSAPGYEDSLFHWTPSIAPSGMLIYSGALFPQWKGDIFLGALAGQHIVRLRLANNTVIQNESILHKKYGRIRDIKEDKDGNIYFVTDSEAGALYKITR